MKRSVYISGISCAVLMLFGSVAKIMHWPGAGIMLTLAVFLFCFGFFPMALKNNYDLLPVKKMKTLHIVSYLVFSFCMMGVLFKIMHWPGAAMFLLIGLLSPFVVFLPVYLYHTREQEKTGNKNFLALVLGLMFLAVFSVFLALSVSKQILLQGVESVKQNESNIRSYTYSAKEKNEITKAAQDLIECANNLKCALISVAGEKGCDGYTANGIYKVEEISGLDNWYPTNRVFLSEEGMVRINHLKQKINTFKQSVLASKNITPELTELVNNLLYTEDNDVTGIYPPGITWEQREFNYSLVFMLDFLSKLQSHVRLVEGEILN
jgi:hypothetical protein